MHRFEIDSLFCSNPGCLLHVRAGSPSVVGQGNWARLRDGRVLGRGSYCGLIFCDDCMREWQAVAVIFPDGSAFSWREPTPD